MDFFQDNIFILDETESSPTENLGQVMFGERIRPSPYKLKFGEDRQCKQVCTKKYSGHDYKNVFAEILFVLSL